MMSPQGMYDLLVVGGGINGCAIAHLAAQSGLRAALVEKGDFASGTSSKSTKLIHGGLRYLENFEFDLVSESLRERFIQVQAAPHLVRPMEFIIPVYLSDQRPLWMMKLGVFLYDVLCGKHRIGSRRPLSPEQVLQMIPGINEEGLAGGVLYFDAQMDDARLCLENALSARSKGAMVLNYTEARAFIKENGKVRGMKVRDALTDRRYEIHAKKVICAVGPWTNQIARLENPRAGKKVRLTKGVHIVYGRKISDRAVLAQTRRGGRFFFVIPWMGHSLIGTTDTDYTGSPDRVEVTKEDIDYLFTEARRIFSDVMFYEENIIASFAGLRPLADAKGNPSKVSRRHVVEDTYTGVTYVTGGKYTTYRGIAEDVLSRVYRRPIPSKGAGFSVYGSGPLDGNPEALARDHGVPAETAGYLVSKYGSRALDVLALCRGDAGLKKRICPEAPDIRAQIVYSIETEMARTADDIIWRRLGLGYRLRDSAACRQMIEKYFQKNRSESVDIIT